MYERYAGGRLFTDVETAEDMLEDEIYREFTDQSRWETYQNIVVKHNGKFYKTNKSHGSTEMQEGRSNWDSVKEVEWHEVVLKEVMVKRWVEI